MPQPDTILDTVTPLEHGPVNSHYDTSLPPLPWTRRFQIPFIAVAVYGVIRTLGPTLRYEVLGWQHAKKVHASGKRIIWAFWHRIILPIVWWHRHHGVVVMNTTAFDGQGHRVARIWHRAGKFIPWRLARACGDGQAARRGRRLRVYHRWAARAALRGKAWASDAGAENRLPDHGVSHRRRPRENVYKDLGSLSATHAFCARRDLICAADLRAGGRQCGSDGSETRGNAARARPCPQYRRRLVSVKCRHPRKIPHPIQSLRKRTSAPLLGFPGIC